MIHYNNLHDLKTSDVICCVVVCPCITLVPSFEQILQTGPAKEIFLQQKTYLYSRRHVCTAKDMFVKQKTCQYRKRHVCTAKDMFFSAKVMFVHQKTSLYSNTNVCTTIYMFVQQKTYLYSKRHVLTEIHRRASRLWTTQVDEGWLYQIL